MLAGLRVLGDNDVEFVVLFPECRLGNPARCVAKPFYESISIVPWPKVSPNSHLN